MEKRNKILRQYRINPFIYDELKKIVEKIGTTETSFVEIAIIEKINRIQSKNQQDD